MQRLPGGDTALLRRGVAAKPGDFQTRALGRDAARLCVPGSGSFLQMKKKGRRLVQVRQSKMDSQGPEVTLTRLPGSTWSLSSAQPSPWLEKSCTDTTEKTSNSGRVQRLPQPLTQVATPEQHSMEAESWVRIQTQILTKWMTWGNSLHLPEPPFLHHYDRSNKM